MSHQLSQRLTGPGGPFEFELLDSGVRRFRRPPHAPVDLYRRAERSGDKTFVVEESGNFSYGEVFASARARCAMLREQGLQGQRIGLLGRDGADWIAWFIAITGAGAVCVMPPPAAAGPTIMACLRLAECAAVAGADFPPFRRLEQPPALPVEESRKGSEPWPDVDPEDEALVAFTSGSSGTPKGVVHTSRSLMSGLRNMMLGGAIASQMVPNEPQAATQGRPPAPATLMVAPLAYVAGFSALLLTMTAGGRIILAPSAASPEVLAAIVADHGAQSITGASPEMIRQLLALPSATTMLASLRRVQLHGEALQRRLVSQIAAALPLAHVFTGYGLTETAGSVATAPAEWVLDRLGGCGLLLPNVEVRTMGAGGKQVAQGKSGQIELRGDMLMRGYLGEANESDVFTPDGWFKTGDIGSVDDDDCLRIIARGRLTADSRDDALGWVAEEALRTLKGVSDAVVDLSSDGQMGVFIQADAGCAIDSAEVWDVLRKCDPSVSLRTLDIVERLPRTASGKVDRRALVTSLAFRHSSA